MGLSANAGLITASLIPNIYSPHPLGAAVSDPADPGSALI